MKGRTKTLRTATVLAVVAIIAVGFVAHTGVGTLSAPGIAGLSVLCPLGALTSMIAAKTLIPQAVVSLVIVGALVLLFARAFCGWVCPVPLLQRLRNVTKKKGAPQAGEKGAPPAGEKAPAALTERERASLKSACKGADGCASCAAKRGEALDARHFVLGGAVVSAAVFGFPVFCLVCPIGLTFAAILLFINLFAHGDVS